MPDSPAAKFKCNACGASYRWKAELAGKKVRCKCGKMLRVPENLAKPVGAKSVPQPPIAKPARKPKPAEVPVPEGDQGPLALEDDTPAEGAEQKCPSCGANLASGAVLCVSCGFNLASGRKMTIDASDPEAESKRKKKEKKKEKKTVGVKTQAADEEGAASIASRINVKLVAISGAAAVTGAVLWVLIAKFTGFEIGYVAIAIGFMAGVPVKILAKEYSDLMGTVAAGLALVALLGGKLLIATWVMNGWIDDWYDDGLLSFYSEALAWDMATKDGEKEVADWIMQSHVELWGPYIDEERMPSEALGEKIDQYDERASDRYHEKNEPHDPTVAAAFASQIKSRVSLGDRWDYITSWKDILFALIAISIAFKMGSGSED